MSSMTAYALERAFGQRSPYLVRLCCAPFAPGATHKETHWWPEKSRQLVVRSLNGSRVEFRGPPWNGRGNVVMSDGFELV